MVLWKEKKKETLLDMLMVSHLVQLKVSMLKAQKVWERLYLMGLLKEY